MRLALFKKRPVPSLTAAHRKQLANLARRAWSLKRTADSVTETSHAFVLPAMLRAPTGYDQSALKIEIDEIHLAIDTIAFDLYGFAEADREVVNGPVMNDEEAEADDEKVETEAPSTDGLLSWAVGVAFGRFDLHIATGKRPLPPEAGNRSILYQQNPRECCPMVLNHSILMRPFWSMSKAIHMIWCVSLRKCSTE